MTTMTNNAGGLGAALQWPISATALGLAASVPTSGSITSTLIASNGWQKLAVGGKSTQAGQLSVQRFLDPAGTIPQGPALTAALTANTAATVNVTDGAPFASFQVTVSNSSASVATLSGVIALLQSI